MTQNRALCFPSDEYLEILVYHDGDAADRVEHIVLKHEYGDQPDHVSSVDPHGTLGFMGDLEEHKRLFGDTRTLAALSVACKIGKIYEQTEYARFEHQLPSWALAEPEHARVWIAHFAQYRFDVFTEEHKRLFRERQAMSAARRTRKHETSPKPRI